MDWTTALSSCVNWIEAHLLEGVTAQDAAEQVYISPLYLQKGFQILTGWTISEYIRNRRLYLAALDVRDTEERIIDIAYKYGYDTPESFTKAFSRFHGVSPMQMRRDKSAPKVFLPLKISIVIQGGNRMDFTVTHIPAFKVIGFSREFSFESSYKDIPAFWDELNARFSEDSQDPCAAAVKKYGIGEFGVCIDDNGSKSFRYMIAGRYDGGEIPAEMEIYDIPACDWAKFKCIGALRPQPTALQSLNTQIFRDWLPNNPEYEIAAGLNLEWYSVGDTASDDYESGIWLPVKRK